LYEEYTNFKHNTQTLNFKHKIMEIDNYCHNLKERIKILETSLVCPACSCYLKLGKEGLQLVDNYNPTELKELKTELIMKQKEKEACEIEFELKLKKEKKIIADLETTYQQKKVITQQVKQLQLQIQALNLDANIIASYQTLRENQGTEFKILTSEQTRKYKSALVKLQQLKIYSPVDLKYYEKYRQLQKSYQEYTKIKAQFADFLQSEEYLFINKSGTLNVGIVELDKSIQKYQNQINALQEETDLIKNSPLNFDPQAEALLKEKVSGLENELIEIESKLQIQTQIEILLKKERILIKTCAGLNSQLKLLTNLQTFKQYAIDTECQILQETVDEINSKVSDICVSLFDKDIDVQLNLYKTTKTTKVTKPQINFAINYQQGTYDNINQMSGGEGDRVSLALTLALNSNSGCPLLLLDESIASLNHDLKERVFKTIRHNKTAGTTVFLVVHDGIEGYFDHVVNVEDYFT
jgi:DNA repair exonuclease SbcCD ATPase subunit